MLAANGAGGVPPLPADWANALVPLGSGVLVVAAPLKAAMTWLCAGISEILSVWVVSPPNCPSKMPWPTCTGMRPCRFGSPKVVRPSPPYVVPRIENSAWFWLIGRSWPLANVQPLGGKFHEMIFNSPRKGSDMTYFLYLRD